ncbi:hypothetical protein GALMADRAFT_765918 [Galerina marginata CBS 339.88]|uniref:Uncharacterized protein n=1 Tax=Galerina marginata (strain CBS 339.88) TaxID=685588 RepID=A0A067SWW8_GALM3|nr:hypothetical protein GALMADRAFT_765918 [Galerina marginata CBS 339.88]
MTGPATACTVCIEHSCAYFDDSENSEICLCGHNRGQHQVQRVYNARGGYPQRACIQFRTIGGVAVSFFSDRVDSN